MKKIGVLGAGTIGMSMARMLCNSGHDILVWSAIESELEECEKTGKHHNLPGMILPEAIRYTRDIAEVCRDKDILLFAIPSVFIRGAVASAREFIPDGQIIADVGKGIEQDTLFTMSQIIRDELSKDGRHDNVKIVALSGPTHAEEVALDIPTTIVSACEDMEAAEIVQDVFMNPNMRVYTNADVLGIELCGALKNVIALACGISTGCGFGDNTKAALITRGMAEITRLGLAMGCMEQTFYGLAGMGDLIVTATSMHSRNNRCGMYIGQGKTVEEAVKEVGQVVEGLNTLPAALQLSAKYGVEMPIVTALGNVVYEGADPADVVSMLMGRQKKSEVSPDALNRFLAEKE